MRGFGGLGSLGNLMKQAQEMGGKMQALGEQMKGIRATGSSGGGMIEVDVNGLGEVLAVRIDKDLFARGDQELLEDLLPAAFNSAHRKAKEMYQEAMQELSGDMNLPGLGEALAKFTGQPPAE